MDRHVGINRLVACVMVVWLGARKQTGRGEATSTKFEIVPPVHAYATVGITDELSAGVGVYTPFLPGAPDRASSEQSR